MTGAPPGRLRVLTLGIERFGARVDAEEGPGGRALAFAPGRADDVADALGSYGYVRIPAGEDLAGDAITDLIRDACEGLGADDLLIVHVVSHGYLNAGGSLCILGHDGLEAGFNNVDALVQRVDSDARLPRTLFFLDLCHAGSVPRAGWQLVALAKRRAWVIAACEANQQAYGGRFSTAVANVLRRLHAGGLDIGPATPFIPLPTVAREIRREVISLAARENELAQQVTSSLVDLADDPVDLPFFPNPRFVTAPIVQARPRVDSGIEPFLADVDEALDASHFMTRASGYGGAAAGCFSGREDELRSLSDWFDGVDARLLRVVVGGPGSGKSALVGVVVCAAHPVLSGPTEPVWRHVQRVPRVNRRFAAVHARHRTVAEISASLMNQLGLSGDEPLLTELESGEPPIVVIDALDEAEKPGDLIDQLLLPLLTITRKDGKPICRMLLAMRPWSEFGRILGMARSDDSLVDLDQVPVDRLSRELDGYVYKLLYAYPPYDKREYAGARATFAQGVAETLTSEDRPPGPFLIAGMYAHHLVTAYQPIEENRKAWHIARKVPRSLESLLELDLSTREASPWLRPILTVLAHARGEGMPVSVAEAAARRLAPASPGPSSDEMLKLAGFYLRRATDVDGISVYRLFHQGLADHLRRQPGPDGPAADEVAALIFEGLLDHLDPGGFGVRRWDLAVPYLLRHAVQHAQEAGQVAGLLTDPEFLVQADLDQLDIAGADWLPAVENLAAAGDERRTQLAVAASIHGQDELVDRLSRRTDGNGLPWSPAWSTRPPADMTAEAIAAGDDGTVAVAYSGGIVALLAAGTGKSIIGVASGSRPRRVGIGFLAGRRVLVTDAQDEIALRDGVNGALVRTHQEAASNDDWQSAAAEWGLPVEALPRAAPNEDRAIVNGVLVTVWFQGDDGDLRVGSPVTKPGTRLRCFTVGGVAHAVSFDTVSTSKWNFYRHRRDLSVWNLERGTLVRRIVLPDECLDVAPTRDGDLLVRMRDAVTYLRAQPLPVTVENEPATVMVVSGSRPEPPEVGPSFDVTYEGAIDSSEGLLLLRRKIAWAFEDFVASSRVRERLGDEPISGATAHQQWISFHLGLLRLPEDLLAYWRFRIGHNVPPEWMTPGEGWVHLMADVDEPVVLIPAFHDQVGVFASREGMLVEYIKRIWIGRPFPASGGIGAAATQMLWLASEDPRAFYASPKGLVPMEEAIDSFTTDLGDQIIALRSAEAFNDDATVVSRAAKLADVLRSVVHLPLAAPDSWWATVRAQAMDYVRQVAGKRAAQLAVVDLRIGRSYADVVAAGDSDPADDITLPEGAADSGVVADCLRPSLRSEAGVHAPGRVMRGS
ncbi:hypothetical protein ACQP2E_18585 [Actinoplanes sp. CA-015351]|uniref:hypothetical protein n=1 Tax=Actinoplanes sp. CA-015351 TaxID=3239897 RepID=UPI003D98C725